MFYVNFYLLEIAVLILIFLLVVILMILLRIFVAIEIVAYCRRVRLSNVIRTLGIVCWVFEWVVLLFTYSLLCIMLLDAIAMYVLLSSYKGRKKRNYYYNKYIYIYIYIYI